MPSTSSNNVSFYNKFHKKTSVQKKTIDQSNFTYRIIISILNKVLREKNIKHILDYGCGAGTIALYLAKNGYSVNGLDLSTTAVESANKSAAQMGLNRLAKFSEFFNKIPKNYYDLAVCTEVIEHVKDENKLLSTIYNSVRKGGYLILSTPSANAPMFRLGLAKKFDVEVGHLRRYQPDSIRKLVTSAGFKVLEVKKTEGIIRNSLYTLKPLGGFIRYIRGPISDIITLIDNVSMTLFGESDIFIIAKKS